MDPMIRIGLAINHSYACWRAVLRGISQYAESKPCWLFFSILPEQQPLEVLRRNRFAGLIATFEDRTFAQALCAWRKPVINVSNILPGLLFPRVGADNTHVGQVAAGHFLDCGLRHFGFFGPQDHMYSTERAAAFLQALKHAGHTCSCHYLPANLPFDSHNRQWVIKPAICRWLKTLPKPVGVFTPGDSWGVQLAEACRQAGLRVPEDVALLGVDDDELDCEFARPRLSSVILPEERVGYEAAALLDRLLAGENPPRAPILLASPGVATRRSTEILAIDDQDVVDAVRFIREHAHLPLRVSDVLREVPVGRRALELRFRKALGWSMGVEIRRAHLERAKRLLIRTALPLKAVAQEAGFSDFRHMAVVFRQELGQSPSVFRRQVSGEGGGAAR